MSKELLKLSQEAQAAFVTCFQKGFAENLEILDLFEQLTFVVIDGLIEVTNIKDVAGTIVVPEPMPSDRDLQMIEDIEF